MNDKPAKGSAAAEIVLIEYADFQCTYCGNFAKDTLPSLDREYFSTGRVRLVYHHLTPPNHRQAVPAAIAAECAGRSGRFWEMHDRLFADQAKLDDASLTNYAAALGLNQSAFKACQAEPALADRISRDNAEARKLRIAGTPAFFVGRIQADGRVKVTRSIRGAAPLAEFQEALNAELGGAAVSWAYLALIGVGAFGLILGFAFVASRRRHALA